VLVFENRGPAVGATIAHPHGQIYAFDFVPDVPLRELTAGSVFGDPGERLVARVPGWRAWVPEATTFPYALLVVPDDEVPDLPSLDDAGRDGLAAILVDVLERLDLLFADRTPYMLWIHQRPFDGAAWPGSRVHVEIVSPWRAHGVLRFVAAGELGSGVFFNPIPPEDAARALRDASP
jgi:UDPglucose--hexose-1-phosphate uridylyltransferase